MCTQYKTWLRHMEGIQLLETQKCAPKLKECCNRINEQHTSTLRAILEYHRFFKMSRKNLKSCGLITPQK